MKLKLIDEDWIDLSIQLLSEVSLDESNKDSERIKGKIKILQTVKSNLKSPKDAIMDAIFYGYKTSLDNMTDEGTEITSANIQEFLKENGYE